MGAVRSTRVPGGETITVAVGLGPHVAQEPGAVRSTRVPGGETTWSS